jgi:hypothetical protein
MQYAWRIHSTALTIGKELQEAVSHRQVLRLAFLPLRVTTAHGLQLRQLVALDGLLVRGAAVSGDGEPTRRLRQESPHHGCAVSATVRLERVERRDRSEPTHQAQHRARGFLQPQGGCQRGRELRQHLDGHDLHANSQQQGGRTDGRQRQYR